jgi:transposase-like protein
MGTAKIPERHAARALRREGLSLREIARRLGVSLSSASVWTREIRSPECGPDPPPSPVDLYPEMVSCGRCRQVLPLASFHVSRHGRQSWCKTCRAEYMHERGELHLQQTRRARDHRRAQARDLVLRLLSTGGCADCGLTDPLVLEFDHIGEKTMDVAKLVHEGYSLWRVELEVSRCEIVCANCHRRRTARRSRTWRVDPDKKWAVNRPLRRRNLEYVFTHLQKSSCIDCGEADLVVLEFDHVGPKRESVMVMVLNEHSLSSLERELASCEVRCANCHRRRTIRQQLRHLRHHLL